MESATGIPSHAIHAIAAMAYVAAAIPQPNVPPVGFSTTLIFSAAVSYTHLGGADMENKDGIKKFKKTFKNVV